MISRLESYKPTDILPYRNFNNNKGAVDYILDYLTRQRMNYINTTNQYKENILNILKNFSLDRTGMLRMKIMKIMKISYLIEVILMG